MSVVQLVSSSRSENGIYFVISSIVVMAILNPAGLTESVINSAVIAIPYSAVLGLSLLIVKPERHLSEFFYKWRIRSSDDVNVFVAYGNLSLRPWRVSWTPIKSVKETVGDYARRAVKSPLVRDDLYRVEGATYLIVVLAPVISLFKLDMRGSIVTALGLSVLTAYVYGTAWSLPNRLRHLVLTWWLDDTISEIQRVSQASSFSVRPGGSMDKRLLPTANRLESLTDMVLTRDWDGFMTNFGRLRADLANAMREEASRRTLEEYLGDLVSVHTCTDKGERDARISIVVNATSTISDSLRVVCERTTHPHAHAARIDEQLKSRFENSESIVQLIQHIYLTRLLGGKFAFRESEPELYEFLTKESVENIEEETFGLLFSFPKRVLELRTGATPDWLPCAGTYANRIESLACELIQGVDLGMWDASVILGALVGWKVDFARMAPMMRHHSLRAFYSSRMELRPENVRDLLPYAIQRCGDDAANDIAAKMLDPRYSSVKDEMVRLLPLLGREDPTTVQKIMNLVAQGEKQERRT